MWCTEEQKREEPKIYVPTVYDRPSYWNRRRWKRETRSSSVSKCFERERQNLWTGHSKNQTPLNSGRNHKMTINSKHLICGVKMPASSLELESAFLYASSSSFRSLVSMSTLHFHWALLLAWKTRRWNSDTLYRCHNRILPIWFPFCCSTRPQSVAGVNLWSIKL